MERDVHGVTPGALDHPVQHALLDCHGNWIGVIGIDERTSSKYQSGWIRRMGLGGETESREEHADFRHMIGQAEFVTGGVLRVIRDVGFSRRRRDRRWCRESTGLSTGSGAVTDRPVNLVRTRSGSCIPSMDGPGLLLGVSRVPPTPRTPVR